MSSGAEDSKYRLHLYISGASPQSVIAVNNIKHICQKYLNNNYKLEIIDIYQQPELASKEQIIAAPTLIKKSPGQLKKLIGDMSNTKKVLRGLDIISSEDLI